MTSLKDLGRIDELERALATVKARLEALEARPCKCSTLSATPALKKAAIARGLMGG